MAEATILINDMTELGVRRLKVMQMGGPVDAAVWLDRLPERAVDSVTKVAKEDKGLGMHYLNLHWRPREVVGNPVAGVERGVYWWIGDAARIRDALADAAVWHWLILDCWPTHAWITEMPSGVEPGTVVELDMGDQVAPVEVILNEGRVMGRCVVVGIPIQTPTPSSESQR